MEPSRNHHCWFSHANDPRSIRTAVQQSDRAERQSQKEEIQTFLQSFDPDYFNDGTTFLVRFLSAACFFTASWLQPGIVYYHTVRPMPCWKGFGAHHPTDNRDDDATTELGSLCHFGD